MVDRFLEPDDEPDFVCSCQDADCAVCGYLWEGNFQDDEPSDEAIRVAEFNYECLVYGEPEKMIAWRR